MLRRPLPAVVLAAVLLAATASSAHALTGEASCRKDDAHVHAEAVFGHVASLAAARRLKARAAAVGFKGLVIQNEGCGDYEVVIGGADSQSVRNSFANEAQRAGFQVTFEQNAPPMEYREGQVVGVFASKRTIGEANALMFRLARAYFRYIDLARVGTRWLVVMPQVPIKDALSIAHEVATAGFRIQFRPGSKP